MAIAPLSLKENYWDLFQIQEEDLEFLYNHLLELETPQTPQELVKALVAERIRKEIKSLETEKSSGGNTFLPKAHYQTGQVLVFPANDWKPGNILSVRPGNNPEIPAFEVIEVSFGAEEIKYFATGLPDHTLNKPIPIARDDPNLNVEKVLVKYGPHITELLSNEIQTNPDLVVIAGRWFPRALLVDVNIGHLNLAEALLEMENGGPLTTPAILEQIELPTDVNLKLTEFSLNLALEEDPRFDEVGPSGVVLWFLHQLEPDGVRELPVYLRHEGKPEFSPDTISMLGQLDTDIIDDLDGFDLPNQTEDEVIVSLTYPHWRAGTLPLSNRVKRLFPSAYESPRVIFTFLDSDLGTNISGWVVRSSRYVFGLRDWFTSQGLIPGSLVHIHRSKNPGEVLIRAERKRPTRDWVRTALVGADGGIVFAMLKQLMTTKTNERTALYIHETEVLDNIWENDLRSRVSLETIIRNMMRELAKLNPQGHVHVEEIYAAVNLLRRASPGMIITSLLSFDNVSYLGNLYFRLIDPPQENVP